MKKYKPKSINEAIDDLEIFLICDLYSKFRPKMKIKKDIFYRSDYFKNESEFEKYINIHFKILKKEVKALL